MPDTFSTPRFRQRLRGRIARILGRLPGALQCRLSGRPPVVVDGQTLDPTLQLLLSLRPSTTKAILTAGSPERARARFRRDALSMRGRPTPVGGVRDLVVSGGEGEIPARHYAPRTDREPRPLLVYFHGGGFMLGDLESHDEVCRLLCRFGEQHVLSIDYRLAPEHPFPAAVEDAEAAFLWAREHAAGLDADPERVAVGGDSAGANLATVVARRTAKTTPPTAQLIIYPGLDRSTPRPSHDLFGDGYYLNAEDIAAFSSHYNPRRLEPSEIPDVSPIRAANLGGLAPALVVTAGFDVLRDEGEAYAQALVDAGTRCTVYREPTLAHGFVQMTPICPGAHRATVSLAQRWRAMLDSIGECV
ncbi:MAG: alpha/beta hydrolase [Gemmatimonadota bacterium]